MTREEVAEEQVGKTTVSRPVAFALVAAFLVTILSIPLVQHYIEVRAGFAAKGHWVWPKAYDVMRFPGNAATAFNDPAHRGFWRKFQAANSSFMHDVKTYEKALEDDSFVARASLPHTQALTAEMLGLGNEQVYMGRDGWLFYQPEVGYLTGEGFLHANVLRSRARSGHGGEVLVQPNPVKAIVDFHNQLRDRGIHLILMPAPVKPMIEPERLSKRYHEPLPIPLQNPSYGEFLEQLRAAGVDVLDVSPALAQAKLASGQPQFLMTDTHWTPEAMELAARLLAGRLRDLGIPSGKDIDLKRTSEIVAGTGDIAVMLKLPASSTLYPPQTVTIQPVSKTDGSPWSPSAGADVLVLGDSFSNIYSLGAMGWGTSAGLVEQLAFALQAPVDAILRNDAAAHATRDLLARELAQGHDRLAGKKVVVWEFAMRELSVGDWRLIDLPAAAPRPPAAGKFYAPPEGGGSVRVTGEVTALSKFPRPGSVPYKDHIFSVSLAGLTGPGVPENSLAVVYLWSMKDNVLTSASGWKTGDRVTLDLKSWNDVAGDHERFNRSELDSEELQLEIPAWGELPTNSKP